jgi:VWFA-related protein
MKPRYLFYLLIPLLLFCSGRLFAQDEVIRIQSELVSFEVSVRDGRGLPIKGLQLKDFVVYEDNQRQQISHLTAVESPFELVLILDTSFSTQQDMELMRQAAKGFIGEIGSQDRVAIVQFSHDVELLADFTSDRNKLTRALNQVGSGRQIPGSSVYDALILAISKELLGTNKTRKAVLMLSDGVDSSSVTTYQRIKDELERAGAGFYFIELDTEKYTENGIVRDRTDPERLNFSKQQLQKFYRAFKQGNRLDEARYNNHWLLSVEERREVNRGLYRLARQELREIADRTGGEVFPTRRIEDLTNSYRAVIERLRTLYSIGYYPNRSEPDGKWHQLRVETVVPAKVKNRIGYWSITH